MSPTSHASFAAVPAAAALTALAARALPLRFEFHPNELGITSATIAARYPTQQEPFWLAFGVAVGGLLAWVLARALGARPIGVRRGIALEACGAAALAAVLFAATPLDLIGVGLALCVGGVLALRDGAAVAPPAASHPVSLRTSIAWALGLVFVASLYSNPGWVAPDGLWGGVANVVHRVPDLALATDSWSFHAEWGQHLAWADRIRAGELPGRDFFCLYGPLYELSLQGVWTLFGRSLAAYTLWEGALWWLGMAGALLLALAFVRRPGLALLVLLLVPLAHLRVGLPLLGLAALGVWRRSGRPAWSAAAGALAGVSLLFSQEFGLAFVLAAAVGFVLLAAPVAALAFAAGTVAITAPVLGWFAAHGALAPMLADLAEYPSYVLAGYGNRPFAALFASLPFTARPALPELLVRLGYAIPAIEVGAILLALPLAEIDPRRPRASFGRVRDVLRADPRRFGVLVVAVFGLLAFRSALGRSDWWSLYRITAPAAVLLVLACDAVLDLGRRRQLRGLAVWRGSMLALVAWLGALPLLAYPVWSPVEAAGQIRRLLDAESDRRGSPRVRFVTETVRRRTQPGDGVLFLPNNAAYDYLTRRTNPTRFVLWHQMVTDAHRAEALDALRRDPPRLLVVDDRMARVDDVPDPVVMGGALWSWLDACYRPVERGRDFTFRELREECAR